MKNILLIFFLLTVFSSCKTKYSDSVTVFIEPYNESCDYYKVLWKVTKVDNKKFDFIINKPIYLENTKQEYKENKFKKYKVFGFLYKGQFTEHYANCNNSYLFDDITINIIK